MRVRGLRSVLFVDSLPLALGRTEAFVGIGEVGGIFPWEWNSLRSDTHSWRKNTPHLPALLTNGDVVTESWNLTAL